MSDKNEPRVPEVGDMVSEGQAEWLRGKLAKADDSGVSAGSPTLPIDSCLTCGKVGDPSTVHMPSGVYVCTTCIAKLRAAPSSSATPPTGSGERFDPTPEERAASSPSAEGTEPEKPDAWGVEWLGPDGPSLMHGILGQRGPGLDHQKERAGVIGSNYRDVPLYRRSPFPAGTPAPIKGNRDELIAAIDRSIESATQVGPDSAFGEDGFVLSDDERVALRDELLSDFDRFLTGSYAAAPGEPERVTEARVDDAMVAFSNERKCPEHDATRQGRNADRESCAPCLRIAIRAALRSSSLLQEDSRRVSQEQ